MARSPVIVGACVESATIKAKRKRGVAMLDLFADGLYGKSPWRTGAVVLRRFTRSAVADRRYRVCRRSVSAF